MTSKEKSGVKNVWKLCPLRTGKSILNFHFDYWSPSLTLKAGRGPQGFSHIGVGHLSNINLRRRLCTISKGYNPISCRGYIEYQPGPEKTCPNIASSHLPGPPGGARASQQARAEERTPGGDD